MHPCSDLTKIMEIRALAKHTWLATCAESIAYVTTISPTLLYIHPVVMYDPVVMYLESRRIRDPSESQFV